MLIHNRVYFTLIMNFRLLLVFVSEFPGFSWQFSAYIQAGGKMRDLPKADFSLKISET